jgi:hypothetical protein
MAIDVRARQGRGGLILAMQSFGAAVAMDERRRAGLATFSS